MKLEVKNKLIKKLNQVKFLRQNKVFVLIAFAVIFSFLLGCASTGTYQVDIFTEMHYNQSYKANEPERLDIPKGAVPVKSPRDTRPAKELYEINCIVCHGELGKGDGKVLKKMVDEYGYKWRAEPDLTSEYVRNLPDATLKIYIQNGINVMPAFQKVFTEKEIDNLVQYIRELSK